MKTVKYQLFLCGLSTPAGTVPVRVLSGVLNHLIQFAERGLRLAIEGRSIKRGHPPAWIEKSVDMTVTGIETGSTVLDIEAPMLGDTVGEQLRQQDFWISLPNPTDTAFTLVIKSINDATSGNLESEYYDGGVLNSLFGLRSFVEGERQSLELRALDRPKERFTLGRKDVEKAEHLRVRTPEPRAFLISGYLNAIEHSQKKFQLIMEEGKIIPGRINEDFISAEEMRPLWGKKVSVKGIVYFKPSGNVRLLDANMLKPMEGGEEIFGMVPQVQTKAEFVKTTAQPESKRNWLRDIWNQWPGDETIKELLSELEH